MYMYARIMLYDHDRHVTTVKTLSLTTVRHVTEIRLILLNSQL